MNFEPRVEVGLDSNRNVNVHRTLPFDQFAKWVTTSTITFTHPNRWREDDVYEDLIHWVGISHKSSGGVYSQTFLGNEPHSSFASSWSLADESSAIWTIFSRGVHGRSQRVDDENLSVQVRVPLSRLIDGVTLLDEQGELYVAPVRYLPPENLKQEMANLVGDFGTDAKNHPDAFLAKRVQFRWEQEVRLLFIPDRADVPLETFPALGLDWSVAADRVLIDPRATPDQERQARSRLEEAGLGCPIVKSDLYQQVLLDVHLPNQDED